MANVFAKISPVRRKKWMAIAAAVKYVKMALVSIRNVLRIIPTACARPAKVAKTALVKRPPAHLIFLPAIVPIIKKNVALATASRPCAVHSTPMAIARTAKLIAMKVPV